MSQRSTRRGVTIIELGVSAAVLAVTLSVVVTMLGTVARQRRGAELRERALEEADNVLERLTAEPWEAITQERVDELRLPKSAVEALVDGELRIDVTSPPAGSATKRIDVSIAWRSAVGRSVDRVRMTTFVERKGTP